MTVWAISCLFSVILCKNTYSVARNAPLGASSKVLCVFLTQNSRGLIIPLALADFESKVLKADVKRLCVFSKKPGVVIVLSTWALWFLLKSLNLAVLVPFWDVRTCSPCIMKQ